MSLATDAWMLISSPSTKVGRGRREVQDPGDRRMWVPAATPRVPQGPGAAALTVVRVQGEAQASPVGDGGAEGDPGGLHGPRGSAAPPARQHPAAGRAAHREQGSWGRQGAVLTWGSGTPRGRRRERGEPRGPQPAGGSGGGWCSGWCPGGAVGTTRCRARGVSRLSVVSPPCSQHPFLGGAKLYPPYCTHPKSQTASPPMHKHPSPPGSAGIRSSGSSPAGRGANALTWRDSLPTAPSPPMGAQIQTPQTPPLGRHRGTIPMPSPAGRSRRP